MPSLSISATGINDPINTVDWGAIINVADAVSHSLLCTRAASFSREEIHSGASIHVMVNPVGEESVAASLLLKPVSGDQ